MSLSGDCLERNSEKLDFCTDPPFNPSLHDGCDVDCGWNPDLVLSTQELPLLADMHALFEQQQLAVERETVDCFHGLCYHNRVDLLEVCAPWDSPLSAAVEKLGGTALRLGLHNGFGLSTNEGLKKTLALVRKVKPRYVHVSPPCFPYTIMQNANQRTEEQKRRLVEKRKVGGKILKNCFKILEVQMQELGSQGGYTDGEPHDGGFEQPLRATSWQEPPVKRMTQLCGGRFRVDGCQHGLVDERWKVPLLKSLDGCPLVLLCEKLLEKPVTMAQKPICPSRVHGLRQQRCIPNCCVTVLLRPCCRIGVNMNKFGLNSLMPGMSTFLLGTC